MTHALSAVSFRDPAGFVYCQQGDLRRQVNLVYREQYDHLLASGLYEELSRDRLLVPHEELEDAAWDPVLAYKVIRPEPVELISYPYEWTFSQLQDAALTTLEIQRRALGRGMTLKDCSVYNVQFQRGRPIFIDTLSFERYHEGTPWVGYRQFCEHFLAPLALMSLKDHRLNQLTRTNIDGIPLDLAVRLLPTRSRFRWGLLMHLHLHASLQKRHSHGAAPPTGASMRVSRNAVYGLVDSLESAVRRLRWRPSGGGWAFYDQDLPYTPEEYEIKARLIHELLERTKAGTAWDLGANTGAFSRIAAEMGISTVAFDYDPACIERMYLEARDRGETRLRPLVLDLFNPSPGSGWWNRERASIFDRGSPDVVMALALIHHLAFTGNQPLDNQAEFFRSLAPWLVVEFIPEADPQVRSLSTRRLGAHHPYTRDAFETCFGKQFSIIQVEPVTKLGRTLYLMRRRGD